MAAKVSDAHKELVRRWVEVRPHSARFPKKKANKPKKSERQNWRKEI